MSEDEPTLTLDGLNLNRDSQDEQLHAYAPVSAIDELEKAAFDVFSPDGENRVVPLSTAIEKVERLLAGYFTDEEFQNLCHRFDKTQKAIFCDGCEDYQKRLFGSSPITELKQQVATLTTENAQQYSAMIKANNLNVEYQDALEKAREALGNAASEMEEHNNEYHHRTDSVFIDYCRALAASEPTEKMEQ